MPRPRLGKVRLATWVRPEVRQKLQAFCRRRREKVNAVIERAVEREPAAFAPMRRPRQIPLTILRQCFAELEERDGKLVFGPIRQRDVSEARRAVSPVSATAGTVSA